MTALRNTFLLLTCFFIAACNPYKKSLEQASSLSTAGLHNEAYERYLTVYQEDPGNTVALIGLRETANALSNKRFSEVQMLHGQGNHERALSALDEAERFARSVQWLDVQPPFYAQELRPSIFNSLAIEYFQRAESAVDEEKWNEATEFLKVARRYNRDMQEITYLERMVKILPDFKKGKKAFELGLYQEAYHYYEKVASIDVDFSDVLKLMDECVERARITATVMQAMPDSSQMSLQRSLLASVKNKILDAQNPFVRLVTRDDLNYILSEQRQGMTGAFDESSVISAGKLIGAEYVILGELLSYEVINDDAIVTERKAYLGKNILMPRVTYAEKEARRGLEAVYRYYLMKTETGEVLAAENLSFQSEESAHWAEFNGDHQLLHPGNWGSTMSPSLQDKVHHHLKPQLDELLNAPRDLVSERELEKRFVDYIGEEVAKRVTAYANSRRIQL